MKTKIFTFFVLVFGFCAFAYDVSDCENDKSSALYWLQSADSNLDTINNYAHSIMNSSQDNSTVWAQAFRVSQLAGESSSSLSSAVGYVNSIQCSGTNGTCSVDLGPLASICSNIYDVVSTEKVILQDIGIDTALLAAYMANFNSTVHVDVNDLSYVNVFDSRLLSVVSNFNNDVTSSFDVLTNQIASLYYTVDTFYNSPSGGFSDLLSSIQSIVTDLHNIYNNVFQIGKSVLAIRHSIETYLPYVQTISNDLKLLLANSTNEFVLADYDFTNQHYSSSLLGFDRFRFYAQGQANNNNIQLYPLSPYDSASHLRNATIYDALSSGFASLLISQGSINNYLYWLKAMAGSNRLEAVEAHLVAVSNLVGRLDDYVLGDFSNEVARLVETLSYVTNRVDYTTNLVAIASLLQSSSNHLASIDSKLDVLDYIKVLSNTPLSDFSGDSYYDYLTNLYLNGASSASPSTNWFERIEILLASMVFGDSASSSISNEVEFTNFSEETIENAFNDYTFQNELNSGIDLVENTGGNFLTILRGFHNAIASVSQPQSIAIGLGGLDGQDTTTYEDVMHGHFQVSFGSGEVDSFTLIVRSMTTIIWILITMMFVYFSARWLLSKVLFFYRLMRTLISSLFLK